MKSCYSIRILNRIIVSIILSLSIIIPCSAATFEQESTVRTYLTNRISEIHWGRSFNQKPLTSEAIPILFSILNDTASFNQLALEVKNLPSQLEIKNLSLKLKIIKYQLQGEIVSAIAQNVSEQKDIHKLAEYIFDEIKLINGFKEYGDTLRYINSFCKMHNSYFDSELIWLLDSIHTLPDKRYLAEDIKALLEINIMRGVLERGEIKDYDAIKGHILYVSPDYRNKIEKSWSIKTTISCNIQRLETNANDTVAMNTLTQTIINELSSREWNVGDMKKALSAICRIDSNEAYMVLVRFVQSMEVLNWDKYYAAVDIRYELEKYIVDEYKRLHKDREADKIVECMKIYSGIVRRH
jgi:hypothetical protein